MTRLPLVTLLLLCLTACGPTAQEIDAELSEPTTIPVPSPAEIAGRWDVLSFEGYQPAHRHGAFANFSGQEVRLRIECNHSRVPGLVRNGRFVPQPGPRMQTEMGCEPGREERDSRYFSFFDRSPTIERLPNGRLRLVAGDSVLILSGPSNDGSLFFPNATS